MSIRMNGLRYCDSYFLLRVGQAETATAIRKGSADIPRPSAISCLNLPQANNTKANPIVAKTII